MSERASDRFKLPPGRPDRVKHDKEYRSLGVPPKDVDDADRWIRQSLIVAHYHIMRDDTIDEATRQKRLRDSARVIAMLTPRARLFEAEEALRGDLQQLQEDYAGAEMEDAPQQSPAPHRATAKRGRPRR